MFDEKLNNFLDNTLPPFLFVVLAFGILKAPLGIKLYLNILPILIGFLFILAKRKIDNVFLPMVVLLSTGAVVSIYFQDLKSVLRLGQVFCMLGFSTFLIRNKLSGFILFFKIIFLLGFIVFIMELLFFRSNYPIRSFVGYDFYRLNGPVGEVNYSGIFLSLAGVLALFSGHKRFFLMACVCWLFTFSRTSLLILILGPAFFIFNESCKKEWIKYWFNNFILFLLFLTPVSVFSIDHYFSIESKVWIEKISNGRLYLMIPYVNMGLDHPFGIGYFRGWDNYSVYLAPIKEFVDSIRSSQINEQHNIFIQVFSEFGYMGYGIFIAFLVKLVRLVRIRQGEGEVTLLICSLIGYSLLNGLNEMIFYIILAYCLRTSSWKSESVLTSGVMVSRS